MARDEGTKDALDFNKGYTPKGFAQKVCHLHIKHPGDWGELYFRDYLQKHPDVAGEYGALKLALKEQFEYDRDAYQRGNRILFIGTRKKPGRNLKIVIHQSCKRQFISDIMSLMESNDYCSC